VQQYTFWENVAGVLTLSALLCLGLFYLVGFKLRAKCLVIGKTTKKPCPRDGSVVLGCRQAHKWKKPVAWIRHMGAARWLDPWLYRLHIVPPSFAPMPMPTVEAVAAGAAPSSPLEVPGSRMTMEAKVAIWSLIFAIIQTFLAAISLAVGGGS
jgi:hypothetical protein